LSCGVPTVATIRREAVGNRFGTYHIVTVFGGSVDADLRPLDLAAERVAFGP
jgi:hypothetical protein